MRARGGRHPDRGGETPMSGTGPLTRAVRLVALVAAAIAGGMALAVGVLGLRGRGAVFMLGLLLASAVVSFAVGAALLRVMSGRRWNRLGTRLAATQVVGVLVALINIVLTAVAMFISEHDLGLLLLLLGYALAIALIFSAQVSRNLGRSLDAIRAGAARMAAGDLSARVAVTGEREVAELATAFNTMAQRLERAFRHQQELEEARRGLITAVSHDIRTPLASMRVMIEAIADGVASDPETVDRYVRALEREVVSLGKLVDDLFELARLDAGDVHLRLEPTPIGALIAETLDAMAAQASRSAVSLQARLDPRVPAVLLDPARIQRVIYNLVQNAIRHTPADGTIVVEVLDRGADVQVNVRDTGEGIPPADLPHVFDRFYRGDRARARDGEAIGAGLGLAIARRLVEAHRGRIWVVQPPEGGSVFSFVLPKEAARRGAFAHDATAMA